MLERLDYTVLTAESGKVALDVITAEGPIDLLVSDMVLPGGMNGVDVCNRLRDHQPGLKCILMSGYNSPAIDRAPPHGVRTLTKPVEYDVLAEEVRETLDR